MIGAARSETGPTPWEVGISWRWQRSDKHFVGIEEQKERESEGSQVVNTINLAELSIRRNLSPRWSWTAGIPYLMAERSSPLRDPQGDVFDRTETHANSIGDVTFTVRRSMWDPAKNPHGNISLGLGIKLPTGEDNVQDARKRFSDTDGDGTVDDNEIRVVTETVDQSIQPGDGGVGFIFDTAGHRRFREDRMAAYYSLTYLFNPQGQSGVLTYRTGAGEEEMSISDQYLARVGVSWFPQGVEGLGLNLGWRIEGVPPRDAFGSSNGFRRPGYATSIEPGASYSWKNNTVFVSVPIADIRNRQRSIPDLDNGRHGDAAFADYLVLAGYWRRF